MRNEKFWEWFETVKPLLGNRKDTFTKMFEYLDALDRPVGIIETGCTMDRHPTMEENWGGDGRSTVLFDRYVRSNGGRVYSIELDPERVAICRKLVSRKTKVIRGDSVKQLTKLAAMPPKDLPYLDLLYLDSFDLLVSHPVVAASHHINELTAIMPLIYDDTLVVVDDAPQVYYDSILPRVEVGGKAMFVAKHAEQVGADLQFYNYQVGWTKMKGPERLPNGYGDIVQFTDSECCHMIDRARAHVEKGHNIQAEPIYRVILGRTSPAKTGVTRVAHAEACLFYARMAVAKLRYGTACDWYREALNVDPRDVEARSEMCIQALRPMANWKIAQQEMCRAVKIEPDNARAWRTLGGIEHEMGNVEATVACYDKQLELAPDDPHAMLDRCTIAMDVADYDGARKLLAKVMKTDRWPDAVHCLAMIDYREGRHEEAIDGYKKAIENKCYDAATAHWNMSLALHSIGRYREGWIEHEWRKYEQHSTALSLPMLRFITPMWDGKKPPPAKIHVHAEAGMGDNIAMSRYLNVLVEMGYEVTYEIFQEMFDLMTRSFPNVRVVPRAADYPGAVGVPYHDYHIPVGSLPAVLETDIDTVPWSGTYLKHDEALAAEYNSKLGRNARRVGLCWSSGIRDTGIWIREYGLRKSMPFSTIVKVRAADDLLVSLQVGPERLERPFGHYVIDVLPEKPTWDDTCALIANLDLVITVDTAVAHAAGAMGKPVWLLMHVQGSWHWMAERPGSPWNTKSPWYPSVRIFRAKNDHEWDGVVEEVRRELMQGKVSLVA